MRPLSSLLSAPQVFALLPTVTLISYWVGGETLLISTALLLPLLFISSGAFSTHEPSPSHARDGVTGLHLRDAVITSLNDALAAEKSTGRTTACLSVEVDDFHTLVDRIGTRAADIVLRTVGTRMKEALRDLDIVSRTDTATFTIALSPVVRADLEAIIQLSGRLQSAINHPVQINAAKVYITCSIGFCLARKAAQNTGESLSLCAEAAKDEASRNGPSAIRSFSIEMLKHAETQSTFLQDIEMALENGEIQAWYQPQISTDTGQISGFEALARWQHPQRGIISPGEFLPAIENAGLSERLSEAMLSHSLTALNAWDKEGIVVPQIGVNFSSDELRNPRIVDKIRGELDRFNLHPKRLAIEILETVAADTSEDIITRNINGLSELGCSIDLDDYGTGHASIASIRRFAVGRIKIDRSFVTNVDHDQDQQKLVAAILTMAERLSLDTLAEGVETIGEHAMLAQLGCGHIQGFNLARPMPYGETISWIKRHNAKIHNAPQIGKRAGSR
jgi:diguanylate cyclase (GGDEF)-like protein